MSDLRSKIIEAMALAISGAPFPSPRSKAKAEAVLIAIGEHAAIVPRENWDAIRECADIGLEVMEMAAGDDLGSHCFVAADLTRESTP